MNKILSKYRSAFLSFGFLIVLAGSTAFAADAPDAEGEPSAFGKARTACVGSKSLEDCTTSASRANSSCSLIKETQTSTVNGVSSSGRSTDVEAVRTCRSILIGSMENYRDASCKKAADCKSLNKMIAELRKLLGIEDTEKEEMKEGCDNIATNDSDLHKECSKVSAKQARSCVKSVTESGGFMNSEEMQMASPMLGMVSGADTLLGIYSAMNDRPDCTLSKEDFKESESKLEDQKKDLEEKVKENMKDAETAQTEYADKLKSWAEAEGKIADRLNEMPNEKEDAMHKLDNEKLKAKMQADSKYSAMVDQIADTRRKYTDMISAKAVALSENSSFAIHDRCAIVATGGDPSKQTNASAKPTAAVQGSFAGAFAQGKTLTANIQKRYDNCVTTETLKQKRIESTFVNELASLKSKLTSYDSVLGQINEEKRLADQEIIYQMQNIEKNAAGEAKKLAAEYQRIQTDKANEQTLLKQKLERLNSETKKYQQQVAILAMKLSMYSGKRPAKTADEKSMGDMINQCGENYAEKLVSFKEECCDKGYRGTGRWICSLKYSDYSKPAPAKVDKNSKTTKKAGKTE